MTRVFYQSADKHGILSDKAKRLIAAHDREVRKWGKPRAA